MDFYDSLIRMVSALAIVLGLMAGLVALSRRYLAGRGAIQGLAPLVQILGSGYLGPRKSVAVVSVAGELFVVGMTATDLVPIGRITDPSAEAKLSGTREFKAEIEAKV